MRKGLVLALSLFGLFDSTYLWWVYTSPSRPMVCLGTGCDVVRASSYAHVWGHPLPAYGAILYGVLALLIFGQSVASARAESRLRLAVAATSAAGFLASLYLTGIEAFVLHAWCAWCLASAICITLIFVLAAVDLARPAPPAVIGRLHPAWTYLALFIIGLILGVPAFGFLARRGALSPPPESSPQALSDRLVRPDSHVAGNPVASVTVVEFADFECLYCGQAEKTAREIRKKYGKQIRFVFRHFPQPHLHPQAEKAAEASECAAEQGKFWQAAEEFYDHQNSLSEPALERHAQRIGLDMERFRQCLSAGRMTTRVQEDLNDARALGVRATPTFIIGRRKVEGAPELAQFSALIEQELQKQGATLTHSSDVAGPLPSGGKPRPPAAATPKTAGEQNPLRSSPTQAKHDSQPAPHALAGGPGGIFSEFQSSTLACSEEEARKAQPVLIRTPEARQIFHSGSKALFVDVRAPTDFARGRIPGAVNVPLGQIEQRWSQLPKDRSVVLYESGTSPGDVCASSRAAGRLLLAHGFAPGRVKVYQDGLAAWEKEGLPVER